MPITKNREDEQLGQLQHTCSLLNRTIPTDFRTSINKDRAQGTNRNIRTWIEIGLVSLYVVIMPCDPKNDKRKEKLTTYNI